MKVLYLGGFELPDKNAAAHRVRGVGEILRLQGATVYYCGIYKVSDIVGNQIAYPKNKLDWFKFITSGEVWIEKIIEIKPSVVILYNFPASSSKKIIKYCKKNNIKVYGDITEWYTAEGGVLFRIIKGYDTWSRMTRVNFKYDGIITISKYLTNYYCADLKTFEIPPVNKLEKYVEEESACCEIDSNVTKFIYSGSPGQHKDYLTIIIETLVTLIDYNFQYTIVGLSKKDFLDENPDFEDSINLLGNKVVFLGRLSHEMALHEIYNSDFSLFVREKSRTVEAGFPTKLTEALSLGIPVITNYHSNIANYLINGENSIIVEELTKEGINNALVESLALDRNQIEAMKKSIDRSLFSPNRYIKELKIDDLLSNK